GLTGWGEVCPLGPAYLPAFAEGARAALREMAPAVVGLDPRNLGLINDRMDAALRGHGYAKSPIDIACWDLLGRAAGCPVSRLLEPLPRVYLEQPCPTLEECLYVRRRTTLPIVLDEIITDVHSLLRAFQAGAMEAINLKISKVGGLTRARVIRDLAAALGVRM